MRTRGIILTCIILVTGIPAAMAQQGQNRTDGQGRKQGTWVKTDTAGRKVYSGQFRDNIPIDTFRYFYPDGKLKTISVFSEKGKKVTSESFFPNGKPMAKGIYRDEKKDSLWQFFSEYDGTLVSEEIYRNGIKDGTSKVYFPEGGVSEITTWSGGTREGLWETYYTDGKVKMKGAYHGGDKSGPFVFYYNSGKVMITGSYAAGHQDGVWIYYSADSEVARTEKYDKGILISKSPEDTTPERK